MPALARGNTKGCVQDKATRATYDVLGHKVTTTAPGSDRAQFYYVNSDYAVDDLRLHKQVNPDDTWTEFTYGKLGRVTHTHTSTGATTNSTYDMGGRCVSSTNSNGFVTTFTYDHLGRQTAAGASGQPTFSEFEYNTLGWKLKIQDADGFTSIFVFNNAGRVTSETTAGHTTATTYDSAGLVLSRSESAENRVTSFTHDYFARATNETVSSSLKCNTCSE